MTLGCHGALRWGWEGAVPRAASSLDSISDAPRLSLLQREIYYFQVERECSAVMINAWCRSSPI